jgi:hypothetical protein
MNVFEKDSLAMKEARQFGGIVAAWGRFTSAIEDLLESYNDGERGQEFPARLLRDSDTMLSVSCPKGPSDKVQLANVLVTARAKLHERDVIINCTVSRWLRRGPIRPILESERHLKFTLDRDGLSLCLNRETLSPYSAAERLLELALLKD